MTVPTIPANYLCPITVQIMFDPVIAEDGCTYEREAIEKWFNNGHDTSPMGHGIIGSVLIPNRDKKFEIMQFLDNNASLIHEVIKNSITEDDNLEFINALIKRNSSDLNRRQKNTGNTPLHIAVMHNKINVTQLLLQAGADCKVRNNQHKTPKKIAKELEFWEILNLIDNYHPRSNQMTSGTDDLRHNIDMLQQENRQLDTEITRLTTQMQRLNVNQQHREQPNFLRFFSRQAMELLALGTMVAGVAAVVQYQRAVNAKLREQVDTQNKALSFLFDKMKDAHKVAFDTKAENRLQDSDIGLRQIAVPEGFKKEDCKFFSVTEVAVATNPVSTQWATFGREDVINIPGIMKSTTSHHAFEPGYCAFVLAAKPVMSEQEIKKKKAEYRLT